jgi:DNA polymerase-3 subunit delta'
MQSTEAIGQQEAWQRLMQLVDENRIPHALMFVGPQGSGKLALALAFASFLLGEPWNGKSMVDNDALRRNAVAMLAKWQHPDLHFSFPIIKPKGTASDHKMVCDDFAKQWHELLAKGPYFTMEQWMTMMGAENQQAVIFEAESDALSHRLYLKPSQGGYKVSVIWLPERMNLTCANKMLKLLEEPPQKTVFLLVSEEPERLLETIRSRVQRFDVHRIADEAIEQALVARRGLDEDTAHRVARSAMGSWLQALQELDAGNENRQFFDLFVMLMRKAYTRDLRELKNWSEAVTVFGREKQRRMLVYFLYLVRENFMFNFRQPDLNYMTSEEEHFAQNFARFINERNVVEMGELLQLAYRNIGQNANAKIVFFDLAMKMIILLRR